MKGKLFLGVLVFGLLTNACTASDEHGGASKPAQQQNSKAKSQDVTARASHAQGRADDGHGHTHDAAGEVPAFQTDPADLKSLAATLAPEKFTGKQRLGYEAVRAIPETIAQLPCYCHCDKGFGHKSLHSCFVDDHAAHCAICIDEALLALQLQKQEKLTPEQIRERIIAQYGSAQ